MHPDTLTGIIGMAALAILWITLAERERRHKRDRAASMARHPSNRKA